ncbi:MAG TPA: hypothetical protein VI815_02460 [Candidatus Nanoarchaeia archaeon]|nr:hypothetical protein [Candidatus Nanoarchaeia archaeon]
MAKTVLAIVLNKKDSSQTLLSVLSEGINDNFNTSDLEERRVKNKSIYDEFQAINDPFIISKFKNTRGFLDARMKWEVDRCFTNEITSELSEEMHINNEEAQLLMEELTYIIVNAAARLKMSRYSLIEAIKTNCSDNF